MYHSKESVILLTMTSKTVTITSKNQITLPAELVRRLGLTRHRVLRITEKKGVIELKPAQTLEQRMQKHWDAFSKAHPNHKPMNDEELKTAIGEAVAYGAWEKER